MNKLSEAPSLRHEILGLLEDHLELGQLEYRYESEVGRRRLLVLAFAALCLLSSLVFVQMGLFHVMVNRGFSFYAICLMFAVFWAVVGICLYQYVGRRDVQAGKPFEGTGKELRRSIQWIQTHFS